MSSPLAGSELLAARAPKAADRERVVIAVEFLRARNGVADAAAFAAELGVRQQTVSEWETGRYAPRGASARVLSMLAEGRSGYDPRPKPLPPEGEERGDGG